MKRVRDNILSVILKNHMWRTWGKTEFKHHIRLSFRLFIICLKFSLLPQCPKPFSTPLSPDGCGLSAVSYENEFILTLSMLKRFCLFHQVQKTMVHSPLLFLNVLPPPPPLPPPIPISFQRQAEFCVVTGNSYWFSVSTDLCRCRKLADSF